MFALYVLGSLLEPSMGTPRFVGLLRRLAARRLAGALILSGAAENTVGASGAIFGIFGAAVRDRPRPPLDGMASEIGLLLIPQPGAPPSAFPGSASAGKSAA